MCGGEGGSDGGEEVRGEAGGAQGVNEEKLSRGRANVEFTNVAAGRLAGK